MTGIDTSPTRDDMLEHAAICAHAAHYGLPGRTPEWLWQHTTTQNERARFRASSRAAVEVVEAWFDGRPLS